MYADHMNTGWWILAGLGGLIVWGLILWTLYDLVSRLLSRGSAPTARSTAGEVLERRLASGEIDQREYEQIRAALNRPTVSPYEEHRDTTHQPPRTAATARPTGAER